MQPNLCENPSINIEENASIKQKNIQTCRPSNKTLSHWTPLWWVSHSKYEEFAPWKFLGLDFLDLGRKKKAHRQLAARQKGTSQCWKTWKTFMIYTLRFFFHPQIGYQAGCFLAGMVECLFYLLIPFPWNTKSWTPSSGFVMFCLDDLCFEFQVMFHLSVLEERSACSTWRFEKPPNPFFGGSPHHFAPVMLAKMPASPFPAQDHDHRGIISTWWCLYVCVQRWEDVGFQLWPAATTTTAAWSFMLQTASLVPNHQSPAKLPRVRTMRQPPICPPNTSSQTMRPVDGMARFFFRRLRYGDIKRLL